MERLLYLSKAHEDLLPADVSAILALAEAHNTRDGLTGALLKYAGHFIQVLEGPSEPVQRCFERIGADPRHYDVHVLRREPVVQRRFGHWSMRDVALDQGDRAVVSFLDELVERRDPAQVDHLLTLLEQLAQRD